MTWGDHPGATLIDRAVARADGRPPAGRYHPSAPHRFRGGGPLREVTATRVGDEPAAHWHLVTQGLTELDRKESDDPARSGWGFELTLRLPGPLDDPPLWAVDQLGALAGYVWSGGRPFAAGDHVDLGGPLRLGTESRITAAALVDDPALGAERGPFGRVEFLQLVGLTADELEACRAWSTDGVIGLLAARDPLLVTDPDRASLLDDPELASEVRARAALEAGGTAQLSVARLRIRRGPRRTVVELGAGAAAALGPALHRELAAPGGSVELVGDAAAVHFEHGQAARWEASGGSVRVEVPAAELDGLAALFDGRPGSGRRPAWAGLGWRVIR